MPSNLVLEKTLENPLDSKEIKQVNPKGNQPWIFNRSTDAEAETPILWPPDAKSRLIGRVPDAGKDWRQGKKRMTEEEMVGWHHWLNGHEFEQTPRRWLRTGSLACGSPRGCKESDTTEWLNNMPRQGITEDVHICNFNRFCHRVWIVDYTKWHSYQQCTRVPIATEPHPHLVYSVFLISVILVFV